MTGTQATETRPTATGAPAVEVESTARLLHGSPIAAEMRERVREDVEAFKRQHGFTPALAVLMVGKDAPSAVYLQQIVRGCEKVGVEGRVVEVPERSGVAEVQTRIEELNRRPTVAGIIIQMPLPPHIPLRAIIDTIDPAKDIDGIHPINAGLLSLGYEGFLPATAHAAVEILKSSGYHLEGLDAVVIGRSNVVGKPTGLLLLREHCTVTVCHRRTRDLAAQTRRADLVVVAAGHPALVRGDMLKPGALVVDVGINVVPEGIVGDVEYESVKHVAQALTPVPGGVGPVTNAILMEHLIRAARNQHG